MADLSLFRPRTGRFDREDAARRTAAQIVIGIFGLGALIVGWRRVQAMDKQVEAMNRQVAVANQQVAIAQDGQITERFTRAIDQLGATDSDGKPRLEIRLGGIYALERIARDSEKDHWTIMEVLTAYVRENAPRKPEESPKQRIDIQAILKVL